MPANVKKVGSEGSSVAGKQRRGSFKAEQKDGLQSASNLKKSAIPRTCEAKITGKATSVDQQHKVVKSRCTRSKLDPKEPGKNEKVNGKSIVGKEKVVAEEEVEEKKELEPEIVQRVLRTMKRGLTKQWAGYTLDVATKNSRKKADAFGPNATKLGQWWPYQICALRDGAHRSLRGGIYGQLGHGCYSIILSGGEYDDEDKDKGDVIWYSGSHGGDVAKLAHETLKKKGKLTAVKSNNTRYLFKSKDQKTPIRVIRSSKVIGKYAPKEGLRYDGLYTITEHKEVQKKDGTLFHRFKLQRLPGQPPIDKSRPTAYEIAAMALMKQS
ncbi:hypothetical protein RUND412_006938 [Rhizina undulata]